MIGNGQGDDGGRLEFVTAPTEEQRALLSRTLPTDDGEPINLFRLLVRHPTLMKRVNALGGLFMAHSTLSAREREFVILRTAVALGSAYEHAQHQVIARRVGLTDTEIASAGAAAGALPAEFELVAAVTDELLDHADVSTPVWARVRERYTDEQILELLLLSGFYRMLAGLLNAARLPVDDGMPEREARAAVTRAE